MLNVVKQIRILFSQSGRSYQWVCDNTGVSKSAVSRLMSGMTDNPTLQNLADIAAAFGYDVALVSVDDSRFIGDAEATHYLETIAEKDRQIANFESAIAGFNQKLEKKNRTIYVLSIALAVVIVSLIYLFIDAKFGHWGIIRY